VPLKKNLIWAALEDITTEELMVFHGVILNMAKRAKCSTKDLISEHWLDSSQF
jgi:hypothetical protein